jgi:hypothetical protein
VTQGDQVTLHDQRDTARQGRYRPYGRNPRVPPTQASYTLNDFI